ncbi:zinc finger BED domain-containing protein DAYSLEEPER-like [Vigna angularis]|uniref:zinc finger BED domain-containing protein DAYSLEEPER-like n=1 Tax=Phaseolus angularis TaxID=3914 RepID=UPI0022B5B506|nr:zinc finger BED domain-containing protein DAYSLEEPER-like [Vigna angularis]
MAASGNDLYSETRVPSQQMGKLQMQTQDALFAQNEIIIQQLEEVTKKLSLLPQEIYNISMVQKQQQQWQPQPIPYEKNTKLEDTFQKFMKMSVSYRKNVEDAFNSSSYPTSKRYFMQVWKIECLLRENVKSDDMTIKDMSLTMMNKFNKYWDQYYDILAIGAILDPRMKFEAIRFCYRKINPSTYEEKINVLKDNMYKLVEEYVKLNSNESNTSSSQVAPPTQQPSFTNDEPVMDAFDEYVDYLSQHVNDTKRSELDLYLDEGNLDPKFFDKLDVLSYWRDRQDRYPNLSKMACDILSIPITAVASESAFSLGSRVLTKYRSSILPENVEALILTQNWLHGFELTGNIIVILICL